MIRWRPEAIDRLEEQISSLEAAGRGLGGRFLDAVMLELQTLEAFPGVGSVVSEPEGPELRMWIVGGFRRYLMLYRPVEAASTS